VGYQLTARDIFGRCPAQAPRRSVRLLLTTAIELLPTIEDDLIADLVEHLACAIADQEQELGAGRAVLSQALELLHAQHIEIGRQQKRLAGLLDERRQARTAAA
jgi:hypothetical protein